MFITIVFIVDEDANLCVSGKSINEPVQQHEYATIWSFFISPLLTNDFAAILLAAKLQ